MVKFAGQSDAAGLEYGDRRDALIRATITLGAGAGLRALTHRGIATRAGVAHGLIAHHFGSMDALLEAALLTTIEDSVADLDLSPVSGRVEDFARNLVRSVGQTSDNYAFQYQAMLESRQSGDGRGFLEMLHTRYRAVLRSALENMDVPADDGMVELVYTALEGVVFHQVVHVEDDVNEKAVATLRVFLTQMRHRD